MQGNSAKLDTSMVEYDNLPAPQLNEALLDQLDSNIKGTHWSVTFQCITMIRAICKTYPQHINDLFGKYGMTLLEIFNNGTTLNIKNILKLLTEIFLLGKNIDIETLVAAFLPLIAKKAASQSGQVKELCQELLTVVTSHCCFPRAIEVCTELSCDKNIAVSQMAIKLLSVIIMNIGPALTQLDPSTLQMLMKGMSFLINGKRNNMKTSALDVCIFICNQIGSENYIQLSNYALSEQEVISMTQLMETHRIQKQKGPQLADYLKQYKTEVRQRQSGAWGQGIR